MVEFKSDFRCIALDLRNANGGQSTGPLEFDHPWESHAENMIGLLDHLKIDRFMVMVFCIGNPLLVLPDDTEAHCHAVAMEMVHLAPNAQVSLYPWKDTKENTALAARHARTFLRANRPQ